MVRGAACKVYKHFENLTDPRADRGTNHDLCEMIFMALTAAICGANGWADVERFVNAKVDWFARFLELERGVPSHDTFGGRRLAILSSFTATCQQFSVNPWAWLKETLTRLPVTPADQLCTLLPTATPQ